MSQGRARLQFSQRAALPMILQDELAECGHACVAMISHFWGQALDLYTLRTLYKPSIRGVTLRDIKVMVEQLSFKSRALRIPLTELHHLKKPAILHWNMNHFVVLKQVRKKGIVIHDPALGVRFCSMDEVSQSFTGIVLEIEPSDNFQTLKPQQPLRLYDLVKSVSGVNTLMVILLVLSLSIELLSLFNPLFLQYVTDDVIGSSHLNNLYTLATGFVLLIFLYTLTDYVRGNVVIYLSTHMIESCSSNIIKHLLKLPLAFFETRHKGDLQSKFQSIDQIQKKISTDFINTVLDGFMVIVNLTVMLVYSRLLTSLVVLALLLYIAIRYASYLSLKKQTAGSIHQHAMAGSVFLETLQGISAIKSFLKENVRLNTWRNCYISALNADIRIARLQNRYHVANQLLFNLEHIAVISLGAGLVVSNQFSVGMLIAFLSFRLLLVNKSSSFIQQVFDYKLMSIQLQRLSDILYHQREVIDVGGIQNIEHIQGHLVLSNISYQYNQADVYILNQVNLEINAGEKIAIIGQSGCGKSTLLKVMMGLLKPTSGEIFVDNYPLSEFGLKNYRELTASVMQDDVLFCGSILDNIAFFDETIDLEHVYHVATLACIHETIRQFPMGYETLVGDMGSSLSGGQKQRILLARALYKNPKILFLDEATSHLDVHNETQINQALKSLNITQIIVAHRQETINMADRVIDIRGLNPSADQPRLNQSTRTS